jgi:hypothetical protein
MTVVVSNVEQLGVDGTFRKVSCDITWDSSYPTAGEVLTPTDVGLQHIERQEHFEVVTPDATAAVISGNFTASSRKLKLNDTDSEVANTSDMAGLVTRHIFLGN